MEPLLLFILADRGEPLPEEEPVTVSEVAHPQLYAALSPSPFSDYAILRPLRDPHRDHFFSHASVEEVEKAIEALSLEIGGAASMELEPVEALFRRAAREKKGVLVAGN